MADDVQPPIFTPLDQAALRNAVTELFSTLDADELAELMDSAREPELLFCIECGWPWPDGQERCAGCGWPDVIA